MTELERKREEPCMINAESGRKYSSMVRYFGATSGRRRGD